MEDSEIKANKIKIEDYISRLEQLKREEELISNELDWYIDANGYDLISSALELNGSLDDASEDFDKNIDYLKTINEKISEIKRLADSSNIDLQNVDIEVCKFINNELENPNDIDINLNDLKIKIKKLEEKLQKDSENKKLITVINTLNDYYKAYCGLKEQIEEML